jgi:hypothetical protein
MVLLLKVWFLIKNLMFFSISSESYHPNIN